MILGIHGAFSSPKSLNFMKEYVPDHKWNMADYSDSYCGTQNIIDEIDKKITSPTVIVGHSLGGIIGINLLRNKNVKKVITISSPVNGLWFGYFIQLMILRQSFVTELKPTGSVIVNTKKMIDLYPDRICSIITTKGMSPYMIEQNDGVVTVASQVYGCQEKCVIEANHHEVLQTTDTVQIIKNNLLT